MTRDRTRTMVLRNSRSIQKHLTGTACELSYCDMRTAGCALCVIALRSHLTNLFLRVTVWRHVVWRSDVTSWDILTSRFTSRPPAIRHIHVKKNCSRRNLYNFNTWRNSGIKNSNSLPINPTCATFYSSRSTEILLPQSERHNSSARPR